MIREEIRRQAEQSLIRLYWDDLRYLTPLYPLNPQIVFRIVMPYRCRLISYQRLSEKRGVPVHDISELFGSNDGCTHYDIKKNRYLVAYNSAKYPSRVRWTLAHELGHIICGHFPEVERLGTDGVSDPLWQTMEDEADYFAASLLAPIPALRALNVKSSEDIMKYFGLSNIAAGYRWTEYRLYNGHNFLDDCFIRIRVTSKQRRVHPDISVSDDYISDSTALIGEYTADSY